ncbi:putative nuclease HARBI1 [Cinnamomum micranthum f. kanehirae]|uniref:Putative nuclease HARBI1 n=1 Tax=Cinnamomum micranthum f. kanehirae TaxID=337451 RepID=A0A3S3QHU8_9MAGN|nr:putative nuclease HARBI1 [Cinnamomum micranthum f. kanehirae]
MSQNYIDSSSDTADELWHTVINSDSDEELQTLCRAALEEEKENLRRRTRVYRSSIQGHAVIHRGRISGHHRLYNDYFSENPVYTPSQFRRRFRMRKPLFLRIWRLMTHTSNKNETVQAVLVYQLFKRSQLQ